jgi:hypothetical protein
MQDDVQAVGQVKRFELNLRAKWLKCRREKDSESEQDVLHN